MARVNFKQLIVTKTYHFRCPLWGKSYRTIVAGTQQIAGTWKRAFENCDLCQKKSASV